MTLKRKFTTLLLAIALVLGTSSAQANWWGGVIMVIMMTMTGLYLRPCTGWTR